MFQPLSLLFSGRVLAIADDFRLDDSQAPTLFALDSKERRFRQGQGSGLFKSTHGAIVEAHARMVNPDLFFRRYQINQSTDGLIDIRGALQAILKDLDRGEEIDAVNLSCSFPLMIAGLKRNLNLPELTVDNVHEYREEILSRLNQIDVSDEVSLLNSIYFNIRDYGQYLQEVVTLVSKITETGVPVFVASGNAGHQSLNTILLAEGVTGVGALEQGKPAQYSGVNTLVKLWKEVGQNMQPVFEAGEKFMGLMLGPYKGEVQIHLPAQDIHNRRPEIGLRKYQSAGFQLVPQNGTSLAAPQAAAEYLLQLDKDDDQKLDKTA